MSDPNTAGTSPGASPGPTGDWRQQRRDERNARRAMMRGTPIGGIVIIAIGVIFLLGNFGVRVPAHWWAIFLLIPAVGLLVAAIRFYRVDGSISGRAVGPMVGGILLLAMALAIFFGLNWGLFWPIVLIAVGAAIIARRGLR